MFVITQKHIKSFILIFAGLLPLQLTIRSFLHLPAPLLLIYIFWICAFFYFIFYIKKPLKITKLDKIIFIIMFIFALEMLCSILFNYSNISDKNIPFQYYVTKYSRFWDSPEISSVFAGVLRPFVYFTFSFYMIKFIKQIKDLKIIYYTLIFTTLATSLYSIYQFFAYKYGLPFSSVFSGHNGNLITTLGIRRCEGIFYEPGPQATFLSVTFSLILYQLFNNNLKKFYKYFYIFLLFCTSITLFLTLSPIGILTPFLTGLIFLLFNYKQSKKLFIKYCLPILIVLILILCNTTIGNNNLLSHLFIRIKNLKTNSYVLTGDDRSVRTDIGKNIFKNHILLGVGPGNDGFYYAKYAPYAIGGLIDKGIVLNNNLKILTDSGILGFVCYLFLLLYPAYYYFIKHHMYCKSCKNNFIEALINSLFTSEILLVSLTFTSQVEFFQPLFWLIYSMLIASINLKKHLLLQNKHMET